MKTKLKPGPEPAIWSADKKKELARLYPKLSNAELAILFGIDVRAIRNAAARFGLKKTFWTAEREKYILTNWDKKTAREIAADLKLTRWSVINKYRELAGLR